MNTHIGYVTESVYSESSEKKPITLLSKDITKPIKGHKELLVNTRFNCPCCDKGITIQIKMKM